MSAKFPKGGGGGGGSRTFFSSKSNKDWYKKNKMVMVNERGMCIKGLFWPPLEPKTESCFSPISS